MSAFDRIKEKHRPRTSHLSFLKEIEGQGFPLAPDEIALLIKSGDLTPEQAEDRSRKLDDDVAHAPLDRYILDIDGYLDRCKKAKLKVPDEIRKEDWDCLEPAKFDQGFIAFILSHYKRFCDLKAYRPFFLYIMQARQWIADGKPDLAKMDFYRRRRWYKREFHRHDTNSMYALWSDLHYKEVESDTGEMPYEPTLAMFFLAFLFDQRRSMAIGKGRQIASTTTFAGIADIKLVCRKNLHVKFIACDLATTEEIFEDKVKYGFGRLPSWIRPVTINDKDNLLRVTFNKDAGKGVKKAMSSKIAIVAPSASAINGGAPDVVFIDEAPFLEGNMFDDMMVEGRPALFKKVNGELSMRRQFVAWGTGGRAVKGGGSYERFHRRLFDLWISGEAHSEGMVPVFLDWTCRPGMTEEFYRNQLARVMAGNGTGFSDADREAALIQFRQTMPSSLDDMYTVSANTLVSTRFIVAGAERCNNLPHDLRGGYGRFEPVHDTSRPSPPDSFFPFRIKGVQWVPASDGDINAPVFMFMPPYRGWKGRYYQGTDPVTQAHGLSRHASVIWDNEYKTIPCVVNMRTQDPYESYAQSKLMGMYYHNEGEEFCMELVENNIGKTYIKWMEGPEWRASRSLLTNNRLISLLQGGGEPIGYDSKGLRKVTMVTGIGKNMILSHGKNIYIPDLWSQLRFFTGKAGSTGNVLWAVDDRKRHQDDIIDAAFMAYACCLSFPHSTPMDVKKTTEVDKARPLQYKLVYDRKEGVNRKVPVFRERAAA